MSRSSARRATSLAHALLAEAAHWSWPRRALVCTLPALVLLAAMAAPLGIDFALRLVSPGATHFRAPTFAGTLLFLDLFALPAAALAVPVAALVGPWLLRRGAANLFRAIWISALTGPFATGLLVIIASLLSGHLSSEAGDVATIFAFGIPVGSLYGLLWWALFVRFLPRMRPGTDASGPVEGPG